MWWRKRPQESESLLKRVNQLETELEALKLERAGQMLEVLNTCEKVLHQLGARERKRDRENDEPGSSKTNDREPVGIKAMPPFPNSRRGF